MKTVVFLTVCLLGAFPLQAYDGLLKDRPAKIESVDLTRMVAFFTVAAYNYKSSEKPYSGQIAEIREASVLRIGRNGSKQQATLDDLKPGMDVLLTGVMSISSQIVTEITIVERVRPKQH